MSREDARRTHRVYIPMPAGTTPSVQPASVLYLQAGTGVTFTPTLNVDGSYSLVLAASRGSGTVTNVAASGGTTGLTFSGSPITTSGTLTLGGTLAITNGGTGATSQGGARTALGLGTWSVATGSAYDTPVYDGSAAASVVNAPSSGARVGTMLGWTSNTARGWISPVRWVTRNTVRIPGSTNFYNQGFPSASVSGTPTQVAPWVAATSSALTGGKAGWSWANLHYTEASGAWWFRARIQTGSSISVVRIYVGLSAATATNVVPASIASDYAYVRYCTPDGDSGSWVLAARSASGTVTTTTMDAIAVSTSYQIEVWSDGSSTYARINGGTVYSVAVAPAAGQALVGDAVVITNEGVAKSLRLNEAALSTYTP